MTITVDTTRQEISAGDFAPGEEVEGDDWAAMLGRAHHLYAYYGAELGGHSWRYGSPHLTPADGFTGMNANSGRNLSDLRLQARFRRPTDALNHQIWVVFFGLDAELKVTLRRHTDGGVVSTGIATATQANTAGAYAWATLKTTLTDNEVRDGGSSSGAYVPIDLDLQSRATSGTGGEIYELFAYGGTIPDADIP